MRCRLVAGTVGLGCAGLMTLALVTPAAANRGGGASPAGRMAAQDVAADCEQAAMDTPRGGGALKITTSVPDRATVAPGDDITVTLTWDPKAWSGQELDAALACVEVKGGLDPALSTGERPTANDGTMEYVLHVPDNIRADCDICVQGFLIGTAADGRPAIVASDQRCFMSGPPRPPTPPATTPATTPVTSRPPAPATTTTTAPRVPTEVGGITATQPSPAPLTPAPVPAPAPAPAVAPVVAELPRTGSPVTALVTASGGLTLTFGGLAVIGGAGRRTRRRSTR